MYVFRQHTITSPDVVLFLVEKVMVCASEVASLCGSSTKSEKEACDIDKVCDWEMIIHYVYVRYTL